MTGARSRYPLSALESTRRHALDAARGELATAMAAAEGARARVEAASAALGEATRVRRVEEATAASSVPELDARCRWVARLRAAERLLADEVERQGEIAARAGVEVEALRARLVEAECRLKTVESHRERWERARHRAARAAEEAEQDDRSPADQRRT